MSIYVNNSKLTIMKFYITSILTFVLSLSTLAQIGINTNSSERILDLNGNLRVTETQDKKDDKGYSDIVIANSTGNVDKQKKSSITQSPTQQVEVVRNVYYNESGGDQEKTVVCGRFIFAFTADNQPVFKLSQKPSSNYNIQYGLRRLERRNPNRLIGGHSGNTGDGDYYYSNFDKTFNTTNWNQFQKVFDYSLPYSDNANTQFTYSEKYMINNDFLKLHIIDPLTGDLYKVNFSRMPNKKSDIRPGQALNLKNVENSGLRILICERYYNQ